MSAARARLILLAALVALPPAWAADTGAPAAPVATVNREALADLLLQLEQAQAELRELRGKVEVQTHELEALKARQRDLLSDIDRRLRELERRGAPASAVPAEAPAAPAAAAPPAEAPAATTAQEQQQYDAAFNLMKQGYYERASKAFRDFIAAHPRSPLVDNARYWIGESAYVVRNFRLALEEFSVVVRDHPDSPKAPDALLKTGYCYYELKDWARARDALSQVTARYPDTGAAKSAEQRLAKMKKEGR